MRDLSGRPAGTDIKGFIGSCLVASAWGWGLFVVAVHMCVAFVNVDRAAGSSDELSLIDWILVCVLVPSGAGWSDWFRIRYVAFVDLVVCAGWSVFFMMGMHVL